MCHVHLLSHSEPAKMLSVTSILLISFILRVEFFLFGLYQDEYMPLPYTDIDYYVFTDAAKFVADSQSPFMRATYRYTPLLAWILIPTTFKYNQLWFSFGKLVFIVCDLITGYLSLLTLPSNHSFLSIIWLFNPMVITISTRGSSESLLTSFILLSTYFLVRAKNSNKWLISFSGLLLGVSIHLKIYPLIYVPTYLLFVDPNQPLHKPMTMKRILFVISLVIGFISLSYWMYSIYGMRYLNEAYFYHLIRLDHRHNFSVYNISLYLHSAQDKISSLQFEKIAFIPQLGFSLVIVPLCLQRGFKYPILKDLLIYKVMFIQTFVFIMFNKVCTSQYFIWFLCLLPQYLASTKLGVRKGLALLAGWILTQGLWLFNGWRLEFRGDLNVFQTGLFYSSCAFFLWNAVMASEFIHDVKMQIYEAELLKDKTE